MKSLALRFRCGIIKGYVYTKGTLQNQRLGKNIISSVENLEKSNLLTQSTDILKLSVRAKSCLERRNINYICELIALEKQDLLRIRNLGQATFNEINEKVKEFGLRGWD